jgi:alkaline phosphatase
VRRARNVILFVGDGMSLTTVSAARILEGQLRGEPGEENWLAFERLPYTGLARTWEVDLQVADSAGTMTAMMSGVKTRAGVLGVDERAVFGDAASVAGSRVETLIERAEARGLATGIVTTTRVTHATPAACYAHAPHRDWEDDSKLPPAARERGFPDLARQLVEFERGDGIDVVMGGGRQHFFPATAPDLEEPALRGARRDGRDLVAEWKARYPDGSFVWNRAGWEALDARVTPRLLALFDPSHMEYETDRARDRSGEPSLAEMTGAALDILSRDEDGFVLVVEGGRIDHAHHAGNAYRALTETIALAEAVAVALARTRVDETLLVVTADHGHTLAFSGYPVRGNPILGTVRSLGRQTGLPEPGPARDALGLPYATLSYANGPGYAGASDVQPAGPKRFPHQPPAPDVPLHFEEAKGRPDLSAVDTTDPAHLQEATVPLPSETHSGEDVPVYAGGPGAELFRGVREQSYLYHAMVEALGWGEEEP